MLNRQTKLIILGLQRIGLPYPAVVRKLMAHREPTISTGQPNDPVIEPPAFSRVFGGQELWQPSRK